MSLLENYLLYLQKRISLDVLLYRLNKTALSDSKSKPQSATEPRALLRNASRNRNKLSSSHGVITLLQDLGYKVDEEQLEDKDSTVLRAALEVYRVTNDHEDLYNTV